MQKAAAIDFVAFANVGSQRNGGIPFGSGSMSMKCTQKGPGIGIKFGGLGEHCFDNINDDAEGVSSSWMPGEQFNGLHFVGIQLANNRMVHGIRISTPMGNGANVGGWYHVQYSAQPSANYRTPDSFWCTIGSFTRDSPGVLFKRFSEPVNASAIRILVSDQGAVLDELHIFGEVQALSVTGGLVADMRAMAYTKGMGFWGNQVSGGGKAVMPRSVFFEEGQQAFSFQKGGETIKLNVNTDPEVMPEATYVAWVRVHKDEEADCVHENQTKYLF